MRRKGQFRLGHELSSGDGERLPTTLQLSASFKGGEGPPNGSRLLPIRKQRRTSRAHQTALPLNQEAQQKKPTSRKRRKRIVSAIEIASKSSDEPNNTLRTPKMVQAEAALRAQAKKPKSPTLPTPEQLRKSWTTR
jgi:hypothetical protein